MDFASMKRRDLQALCKRHGLAGGGTNADLVARLAAALTGRDTAEEHAVEVLARKGCLKRSAGGSSSGGSDAAKEVTFVLEEEDEAEVEVEARIRERLRGRPRVMRSPVVPKTRGRRKAGETLPGAEVGGVERRRTRAQAGGDSTDESDAGEAGTDAPVRRSRRNAVNMDAGDGVEMVAGVVSQNNSAKTVQEEEEIREAVDRKQKTRENDEGADVSGQVGVSRRSTRSSGLLSVPAAMSSPVVEKKRGRRKAGDVTEQTCVEEQTSEVQHLGRTLRSGLVVVDAVSPIVSESKRSRRKLQEEEPAVEKVAKVEISGRTTRSSSVAAAVTSPIVIEKKRRRKTEDLHSDRELPTVLEVPINAAPVTRVLRNKAVQVNNSVVEETHFDKKLGNTRQPSRPSTRNRRHQHVASSAEEGSQEQVAPPCVAPPLRRSRRNHSEADKLLNNNTTSESNNWSRAPMEGNDLKIAWSSTLNAAKDGKEDGVAKADGHLEFKKRNPRNGRTKVARSGGEIPFSDTSGKAKAIEMQVVVVEPVRRSRQDSVVPTFLEQGAKGMCVNIRGQELQNAKEGDVEKQPTVKEPVRRSTRKSLVPAMLEKESKDLTEIIPEAHVWRSTRKSIVPAMVDKERKGLNKEVNPEAHVGQSTQKSAVPAMLEKQKKGIPAEMNPDAHVIVRRSTRKSFVPSMDNNENNDYGEMRSAEVGGVEQQLGVEEPVMPLTRKSVVPAVFKKGNKGLHKKMKSAAPVKRSARNSVAPNAVDKMNNDRSEIVRKDESGVRTRNSQTRLQFTVQNDEGLQRTTHKSSTLVISQVQSKLAATKGRPAKRTKTTVLHMPVEELNADDMVIREATQDGDKVTHEYTEMSIGRIQEISQVNTTVEEFPSAPLLEDTHGVQSVNEEIHESESGLGKSGHEEQVASGQLVFLEAANCLEKTNSDEVTYKDEGNKISVNYTNSSCEQTDANGPGFSNIEKPQERFKEQCEVLHMPVEEPNADGTAIREATQDGDEVTHEYTEVSSSCIQEIRQVNTIEEEFPSAPLLGTLLEDPHRVQSMNEEIHASESGLPKSSCEEEQVAPGQLICLEAPNCIEKTDSVEVTCKDEENKKPVNSINLSCEQADANRPGFSNTEAPQEGFKEQCEVLHMPVEEPNADGTAIRESMQDGDEVTHEYTEVSSSCIKEIRQVNAIEEEFPSAPLLGTLLEDPHRVQSMNEEIHESESGLTKSSHEEEQVTPIQLVFLEAGNCIEKTDSEEGACKDEENKKPVNSINSSCEQTDANGPGFSNTEAPQVGLKKQCKVLHIPVEEPNADGTAIREATQDGDEVTHEYTEVSSSCIQEIRQVNTIEEEFPSASLLGTLLEDPHRIQSMNEEIHESESGLTKSSREEEQVAPGQLVFLEAANCIEKTDSEEVACKDEENKKPVNYINSFSEPTDASGPGALSEEVVHSMKKDAERCSPKSQVLTHWATFPTEKSVSIASGMSEDAPIEASESGKVLLPAVETSALPDEQPNPKLEGDGLKEHSLSCGEDSVGIFYAGSVKNDISHLAKECLMDSCQEQDKLPNDLSAPKSPEESAICQVECVTRSGICQTIGRRFTDEMSTKDHKEERNWHNEDQVTTGILAMSKPSLFGESESVMLPTAETSALPDEKFNTKLEGNEENSLICDKDSSNISHTGPVGNNNLSTLKDDLFHDMPAPKSPEESAFRLDDSFSASEGICQTSGRRRVDEISTKLLSFKISSAVKGSYIAMDAPRCAKQGDNLSQSAIAFLGNSENTPATETDPPMLNTGPSIVKDSSTRMLQGISGRPCDAQLAVDNPDNRLGVGQVQQDDVQARDILEKTLGSATPECKHECGLLEEAVLHSMGNDRRSSSVEQPPFGLECLFLQENIEEPVEYGASDVGVAADNPGNKLAMELVQQNDVQVQEGTLERIALCSATLDCKHESRLPEEVELHSMKNETCSSRVEQSPFGLQSLFLQESIEEPIVENPLSPEPVSDHETQVDLSVVSKDGYCVYTSQQDNEKEGLTKPSHEQHVASGQLDFLDAANHMKKDANCEEVSGIRDALSNRPPIAPTMDNDKILPEL